MGCVQTKKKDDNRNKESKISKEDKEIGQLLVTRDKVRQYNRRLDANISQCTEAVKACIRQKEKDKALLALRKKKYMQHQLENGQNSLLQLEQLIAEVESARVQQAVVQALKQGNEFLKRMNEQMPLDDVEALMQDTADAIEHQQRVGELLAQNGIAEDDQDVLLEFEELGGTEILDLPEVPKHALPARKEHHHAERQVELA